jgi:hypothetical protein
MEVARGGEGSGAGRPSAPNYQMGAYKDAFDPPPGKNHPITPLGTLAKMVRELRKKYSPDTSDK